MLFFIWLTTACAISPLFGFILATTVWSVNDAGESVMDDIYLTSSLIIMACLTAGLAILPILSLPFDGLDHLGLWTLAFSGLGLYSSVVALTPWYRRHCAATDLRRGRIQATRSS